MDRTVISQSSKFKVQSSRLAVRRDLELLTLNFGLLIALALCVGGCAVNKTRAGLPPAAQAAIDALTDDITAGRDDKIYAAAAAEWRQAATPDESRASFARVRNTFGPVRSRALVAGQEQQAATGPLPGHLVNATYNTRFERADAIETFTLVERDSHWLLARYTVHSDALKQ